MKKIAVKIQHKTRLYIYVYFNSNRFKMSLGENLPEGFELAIDRVKYEGRKKELIELRETINVKIAKAIEQIRNGIRELERTDRLSVNNLKEYLKKDKTEKPKNRKVKEITDEYKNGLYAGTITNDNGVAYSYETIRSIGASAGKFGEFCDVHKLTLLDLNEKTGVKFLQYAGREIKIEKDGEEPETFRASLSTLAKDIKNARTFLRWCISAGYLPESARFFESWQKPKSVETPKIYLSESELKQLDKTLIKGKIAKYLLLFQIMARTGIRVSDLVNLKPSMLRKSENGYYLDFLQEKTENRVTIPVNDLTKRYLDIFFETPHINKFTPQNLNEYIKKIAKQAGINSKVITYQKDLTGVHQVEVEKWELVTCHVARHSFACNLYLKGAPLSLISRLLGHANEKVTLRYIKSALPDIIDQTANIRDFF